MNKETRKIKMEELDKNLEMIDTELDTIYTECIKKINSYQKKDAYDLLSNIYLDAISMVELNDNIADAKKKKRKVDSKRDNIAIRKGTRAVDMDQTILPSVLTLDACAFAGIGLSSATLQEFLSKTIIMLTGTLGVYYCASRTHDSETNMYGLSKKDSELSKEAELYDKSLKLLNKCKDFYRRIICAECQKYLELEERFTKGWTARDLIKHVYTDIESGKYREHVNSGTQLIEKKKVKEKSRGYRC